MRGLYLEVGGGGFYCFCQGLDCMHMVLPPLLAVPSYGEAFIYSQIPPCQSILTKIPAFKLTNTELLAKLTLFIPTSPQTKLGHRDGVMQYMASFRCTFRVQKTDPNSIQSLRTFQLAVKEDEAYVFANKHFSLNSIPTVPPANFGHRGN